MDDRIRLLGIAPYEEMRTLMQEMAEAHEGIDLTAFVGDLQQGVELARHNFYNDYDAIISRGGTASLLREGLDLPVIEIPISSCDILRAMRLAEGVGGRCAVVGFPNVANSARELGQVLGRTVDIYPIRDAGEAEATLLSIREKGTRAILCDMVAKTTAMGLGLDVVLITSGAEGVHSAFNEALRLYGNYRHIREENRFLRGLIWNQINQTVVFNDQGELFFSTVKDNSSPIVDFLRDESRRPGPESRRHILKQIRNVQYGVHHLLFLHQPHSLRRGAPGNPLPGLAGGGGAVPRQPVRDHRPAAGHAGPNRPHQSVSPTGADLRGERHL